RHWLLVTGYSSLVTRHWLLVTGYSSLVTRHWLLVTGYSSLVTRHCSLFPDFLVKYRYFPFHSISRPAASCTVRPGCV
ncbi:MAG: hypothetical protein C1941_03860, partial [Prosthecochloris sp.]|nr:hypothetical protein [Prosthecochloris sp.]